MVFPRSNNANQSRTYERRRTEFWAYRFAYLLLPLQHIGHRVVAGELHVAVEHDWLTQDGGDVDRILVAKPCKHTILIEISTSNLEFFSCYKRETLHCILWRCIWISYRPSSLCMNCDDIKPRTHNSSCLFIANQIVTFRILWITVPYIRAFRGG